MIMRLKKPWGYRELTTSLATIESVRQALTNSASPAGTTIRAHRGRRYLVRWSRQVVRIARHSAVVNVFALGEVRVLIREGAGGKVELICSSRPRAVWRVLWVAALGIAAWLIAPSIFGSAEHSGAYFEALLFIVVVALGTAAILESLAFASGPELFALVRDWARASPVGHGIADPSGRSNPP